MSISLVRQRRSKQTRSRLGHSKIMYRTPCSTLHRPARPCLTPLCCLQQPRSPTPARGSRTGTTSLLHRGRTTSDLVRLGRSAIGLIQWVACRGALGWQLGPQEGPTGHWWTVVDPHDAACHFSTLGCTQTVCVAAAQYGFWASMRNYDCPVARCCTGLGWRPRVCGGRVPFAHRGHTHSCAKGALVQARCRCS